jgi:hypothetical protein
MPLTKCLLLRDVLQRRPLAKRRSSPARARSQAAVVSHRQSGGGDGAVHPWDWSERLDPSKANMATPVVLLLCICFPINPIQNNPSLVRCVRFHPRLPPWPCACHRLTPCTTARAGPRAASPSRPRAAVPALLQATRGSRPHRMRRRDRSN